MPKLKVFVVYDAKVEAYMQPFVLRSKGEAIRSWEEVCNDGQSAMSKHPQDFTLFETAEFDEATGRLSQHEALIPLATALEAKKRLAEPAPIRETMRHLHQQANS